MLQSKGEIVIIHHFISKKGHISGVISDFSWRGQRRLGERSEPNQQGGSLGGWGGGCKPPSKFFFLFWAILCTFWSHMSKVFQQKLGTKINSSKAGDPLKNNFLSLASIPWLQPCLSYKKKKKKNMQYKTKCDVNPTVHIYTDGSKSTKGVGFAAVFPNITSGGRLTKEASIFTAELYAINAVVHEILKGTVDGNQFTIFSDSRSALLALRSDSSLSPILAKTKELIWRAEEDNIIIDLCWVPGHVNVRGNEKAGAAAKDAALRAPTAPHKAIPHTDMRRPLGEAITNGWHRKWNSLAREGRKLREIKKNVKDWTSLLLFSQKLHKTSLPITNNKKKKGSPPLIYKRESSWNTVW